MRTALRVLIGIAAPLTLVFSHSTNCHAEQEKPFLMRDPSVSKTQIAFSYAGYIWIADRNGSNPRRLTNGGHESQPRFSPDGALLAFTGEYDGLRTAYLMPANGGELRRLTYHPADIGVVGWTPDGKRVIFASRRSSFSPWPDENTQLFTVPVLGGFATGVPIARAASGSFSQDQSRIAYVPSVQWGYGMNAWKHYRGGQTTPIWIAKLSDSSVQAQIPRDNSNDFNPMWVGDTLYFLSDRSGPVTLFAYDVNTKQVRRVIENHGLDIKSASASNDAIVYEQFGSLHLFDLKSGAHHALNVRPTADFLEVRPRYAKINIGQIRFADISPNGDAAVFGAHGEILVSSLQANTVQNLTRTTDVSEIDPAWSPDGMSIAYFSDESGEYALHVQPAQGADKLAKIDLGEPPSFYYSPTWSPDSKKIAYSDKRLGYWYVDLSTKSPALIDRDMFAGPTHSVQLAWSPDSQWIAYAKQLRSHMHALFVYSLEQKKSYQMTDGESDALYPVFDRTGEYLYFAASTEAAFSNGWSDMTSLRCTPTRSVYAIVLRTNESSPISPSGATRNRESPRESSPNADFSHVVIEFDDLRFRTLRLPIPPQVYTNLFVGAPGTLFLLAAQNDPAQTLISPSDRTATLFQFDLRRPDWRSVLNTLDRIRLSADGKHALFKKQNHWFLTPLPDLKEGTGLPEELKLEETKVFVDPRREWKHMYAQVWRDERDFFYDPGLHGLDLDSTRRKYEPFLENISSRGDLNYLFQEMLGNITVSHMYVVGGEAPEVARTKVGLLGADYLIADNRYRFERIYHSDPWDATMRAPLDELGAQVRSGEYLLAVNGREIRASQDIYSYFGETANKRTELTVGTDPDGRQARKIQVVPIEDEAPLRNYAWIQRNKAVVDVLTHGRVAYVYLPNTYIEGYQSFVKSYFAQIGKEAVIIDERYNHGGDIPDFMVDALRRPLLGFWHRREGRDTTEPTENIFGPKVMLVNEMSGSGGDALAWMFREAGVGPLVGKRTWGGLVGTYTDPDDLLDGGFVHTPNDAFYSPRGAWEVENHGVSPDIEVEDSPSAERLGHDPQLEEAVSVALDLIEKNPKPPIPQLPPFPNYYTKRVE